jgi:hypothetical protein
MQLWVFDRSASNQPPALSPLRGLPRGRLSGRGGLPPLSRHDWILRLLFFSITPRFSVPNKTALATFKSLKSLASKTPMPWPVMEYSSSQITPTLPRAAAHTLAVRPSGKMTLEPFRSLVRVFKYPVHCRFCFFGSEPKCEAARPMFRSRSARTRNSLTCSTGAI